MSRKAKCHNIYNLQFKSLIMKIIQYIFYNIEPYTCRTICILCNVEYIDCSILLYLYFLHILHMYKYEVIRVVCCDHDLYNPEVLLSNSHINY